MSRDGSGILSTMRFETIIVPQVPRLKYPDGSFVEHRNAAANHRFFVSGVEAPDLEDDIALAEDDEVVVAVKNDSELE
jgi:hypothetical protein